MNACFATVLRNAPAIAAGLLLTGCLGPTGQRSGPGLNEAVSGIVIPRRTANTLHPGAITYAETVAELGPPTLLLDGQRVIAYAWQTHAGESASGYLWPFAPYNNPLGVRIRAFALVFDDREILQRHAYFSATTSESLRASILDWADEPPPSH
jgi:hypothetical protein